ncbi:MAG TPA: hypothetical protein VIN75_04915 [Burkholderiaceae bacterium]
MNRTRSVLLLATAGLAAAALLRNARRSRTARRIADATMPDRSALEQAPVHHEDLETYQVLLDESLTLTFPASDPICAQAATRCGDAVATPADPSDWRLHRGSTESNLAGR